MFSFLKDHPFAVEAFFDSSMVLTFAAPKEGLKALIPESLELDTFDDKWAFIAVALVQTRDLRPKGFPRIMGNDFFLIGYRVFVRYTSSSGKRLRGLYILKSQTDKKKMEIIGNIFTHYNYTTTDLQQIKKDNGIQIRSSQSGLKIDLQTGDDERTGLPDGSPFADWKEARRYAGPLPFTFTYQAEKKRNVDHRGVRENWKPQPVKVLEYQIPFIESLNIKGIKLANAFVITSIPYWWKRGKERTMEQVRKPFQGVLNIVRFNWHFYLLSAIAIALLFILSYIIVAFALILYVVIGVIVLTTITSLLASMYIYDLSDLYQLNWLSEYVKDKQAIVNIHAGFDETSHLIKHNYPQVELIVLDFYDETLHTEVSIKRARKAYPPYPSTQRVNTSQLPLADESIDLVVVMLSAHEIRIDEERYAFFRELKRVIRRDGRIFVTEHQRDVFNFLVYNIGFFHFLSGRSWRKTFTSSDLTLDKKIKATPFITTYILRKDGVTA